jgi:CheY-like chemotaxis protein
MSRTAAGSKIRVAVLVVDDNADAANTIAFLLRHSGHEVFVAHDGPTAVSLARRHRPDFIFLDLGLPGGMDGYEVATTLRLDTTVKRARIIAVTARACAEDWQRSFEAGIDQHVVKPVDPKFLESILGTNR